MTASERGGAALAASGVSFEKAAALFAAANSSIQNAERIGTSFQTVSARIRGKLFVPPRTVMCELMLCA